MVVITEVIAEQGEDVLNVLLIPTKVPSTLGEVALVPHAFTYFTVRSTYSTTRCSMKMHRITLRSEVHMHFVSKAVRQCHVKNWRNNGLNQSITHVDFMIGSREMDIDGILMMELELYSEVATGLYKYVTIY